MEIIQLKKRRQEKIVVRIVDGGVDRGSRHIVDCILYAAYCRLHTEVEFLSKTE